MIHVEIFVYGVHDSSHTSYDSAIRRLHECVSIQDPARVKMVDVALGHAEVIYPGPRFKPPRGPGGETSCLPLGPLNEGRGRVYGT